MIFVVNYGMGNLCSIEKALKKIGAQFIISNDIEDLKKCSKIILPGVGSFKEGMKNLNELKLTDAIRTEVLEKNKPFLGICLGMQLIFDSSEEGGFSQGLGLIKGDVKKFDSKINLKVPHVGWNNVEYKNIKISIFQDIPDNSDFYFVHSYHAILTEDVNYFTTNYGYDFVSVVNKGNIFGTQFHPEKSQKKGLDILKNFSKLESPNA
ncbi:imidazole glycerol phosphate synthase subunit HisH [Candidatus Woesearchaeota archaeon]|nr:imidazole glycerol phosphate synthase subunit HisH [Candidatus Woesearchaeota archaeon]